MKRSKQVISLLFALALLGSFAIVAPGAAAEEEAPGWVEKTPMKTGRTYTCAETIDGKIYVMGGRDASGLTTASLEIYTPETNSWSNGASMPTPRFRFATTVFNNKIYAIGGESNVGFSNVVEIYDPATNRWETSTPLPTARKYLSAVTMAGKIYVIGGSNTTGILNVVEIYDPETKTWENGVSLPIKMHGFSTVTFQNKIYAFGGSSLNNGSPRVNDTVFVFDANKDTWETGPSMPKPIMCFTADLIGNQIYLFGGQNATTNYSDVYHFDPLKNEWHTGPNLMIGRSGLASAVIDQTVYVIGGSVVANSYTGNSRMEALYVPLSKEDPKLAVLLNPGEEVQLSVSDNLSDNAGLNWTSSGAGVATVDANGKVTAIGPGLCEITAQNADGTFNQSVPVRVLPGTADLFRLAVHLTPSQTKRLSMLDDQEGVTWQSLDEAVVTVDGNGQITAAGAGLAIVEATKGDTTQQMYVRVKAT